MYDLCDLVYACLSSLKVVYKNSLSNTCTVYHDPYVRPCRHQVPASRAIYSSICRFTGSLPSLLAFLFNLGLQKGSPLRPLKLDGIGESFSRDFSGRARGSSTCWCQQGKMVYKKSMYSNNRLSYRRCYIVQLGLRTFYPVYSISDEY